MSDITNVSNCAANRRSTVKSFRASQRSATRFNGCRMNVRCVLLFVVVAVAGCGTPAYEAEPASQSAPPVATHLYHCESQRTVRVSYPSEYTATVEYEGQVLQMHIAISASGARYAGGGLEWWSKGTGPGSNGSLFRHESGDDSTGEILELCREVAAR
jgi:membrane-bound inhibitor of C-type lysozyme